MGKGELVRRREREQGAENVVMGQGVEKVNRENTLQAKSRVRSDGAH